MSNFSALARKKGTNDEPRDAAWIDDYFGPHHYGVRFRGTTEVLDADDYEMVEEE